MRILLPPSEGKWQAERGAPLDLARLAFPTLTDHRRRVIDALMAASARDDATRVLKLPPGMAHAAWDNTVLTTAPTAPARDVYTGVLYDALELAGLDAAARRRAQQRILVFSALFGLLRLNDRIPAYRLSGDVTLPVIGPVGTSWRTPIDAALATLRPGLIVDCRSSAYATMWQPPDAIAVRVLREQAGRRTVVSHMAKHARGLVARALVQLPGEPSDADALVGLLNEHFRDHPTTTATGIRVALSAEAASTGVDVITREQTTVRPR